MKKWISYLLVLALCMPYTGVTVAKASRDMSLYFMTEDGWYYIENDYYVVIAGYNEDVADLEIPSEIVGKSVREIDDNAFEAAENLTKVTIPATVNRIGSMAFQDCAALEEIEYAPVENNERTGFTIEESAFDGCSSLAGTVLPDDIYEIESSAFHGCASLTSLTIPASVDYLRLGNGAFSACTGLKRVTIDWGLMEIPSSLFSGCSSLEEIIIPDSVIRIGIEAFQNCDSLTSIELPNSVHTLADRAFAYCDELETFEMPDSIRTLGEECFAECVNLANIEVSDNLEWIGSEVFYNCTSLESLILPYGCTTILSFAFSGCVGLTDLYLPSTVDDLYEDVFINCSELTIHTTEDARAVISYAKYDAEPEIPVVYDYEDAYTKTEYETDGDWVYLLEEDESATIYGYTGSETELTIPTTLGEDENPVKAIGDYAFLCNYDIREMSIPSGVVSIGHSAFNTCFLRNLIVPESVTNIASTAFSGCQGTITLHVVANSVAHTHAVAKKLTHSIKITGIGFGNNEITIEKGEETYLELVITPEIASESEVIWESSDESVAEVNHYGCVTGVGVGEATITVTSEEDSTVKGQCKVIVVESQEEDTRNGGNTQDTLTPPPSTPPVDTDKDTTPSEEKTYPSIGTKCKDKKGGNCIIIKEAEEGAEVAYASPKNKKVTTVTIPKTVTYKGVTYKVTTISSEAFKNCKKLKKVTIGANVKTIGKQAFRNCKKLKTITISSKKLKSVGKAAFKGIASKAVIKVPKSKKKAYKKLLKGKGQGKKVKIK